MISKPTLVSFKKKSVRKDGEKYAVSIYKLSRFSADFRNAHRGFLQYAQFTTRFPLLKPSVRVVTYSEEPLYSGQLDAKAAKVKDVKKLAKYVLPKAQQFLSKSTICDIGGKDESDFED